MIKQSHIHPPEWPVKLLRFFLKKEYVEEIEGDMEELFNDHLENMSVKKARQLYSWEMLKLLRPVLLKNFEFIHTLNQFGMFKNYFKISYRSLLKNPLTSFINITGLSIAIGICLLVFTFFEYDRSIDQFHKNKEQIFLTTSFSNRDGETKQYGITPRPIGTLLKQDFPQINKVCRVDDANVVLKHEDLVFHERVRFVDPEFLEMFTFPLKWGSVRSLSDPNSIILSNEMSAKYFGEDNPIGKTMLMIFSDSVSKAFTISGVAEEFPKAHAIDFNFLANFNNLQTYQRNYDVHDWKEFVSATFIQIENPSALKSIEHGMNKYKSIQNQALSDWAISSFYFEPLTTLHERSGNIVYGISNDYNQEGRIGMPIIALFMLALACFNYINMAIVSAAKRLKEIGVRKVIGANRIRVIVQFLSENIVITFFALILGFLLGSLVFMPWFSQFSGWPLETKLLNPSLWIFLLVLLFVTGILSGIYPAFYISKFETVSIFKGSLKFGRKNPITKIFLGIQLVLACITITAGVVFTQNNRFQYNQSWGYNQKEALYVEVHNEAAFNQLKSTLIQEPNVLSISGSKDHLGKSSSVAVLHSADNHEYEVTQLSVDANYFKTMELEIIKGRGFTEDAENDKQAIVVNELLVQSLGLREPIGQQFEIDNSKYEIIGVLKNFHTNNFFVKMKPTIIRIAEKSDFRFLSLRVKAGSEKNMFDAVKRKWAALYPEIPFQGAHQQDVWTNYFDSVDRSETFNKVIAVMAVLLACLGLYGLVTLNVSGRVKEFSIRKTLGADIKNFAALIMNQYTLLISIALIVGAPISYLFAKAYLDMLFAYPMPMGYSGIILSVLILIGVLLAVIATQIRKVSISNPVNGLKAE